MTMKPFALTAGGHTFGKTHGAGDAALVGPETRSSTYRTMGLGWDRTHRRGEGK